jgi:hypothetical protein
MAGFDAAPVESQVCGSMLAEIGNDVRAELNTLRGEMDELFGAAPLK